MSDVQRKGRQVISDIEEAKLLRAVYSERQLEEVLVDFWFNHFNVFAGKGATRNYVSEYEREAIRPYVLGNFRDMLGATAKSPAMLFYLDNWLVAVQRVHGCTQGARCSRAQRARRHGCTRCTRCTRAPAHDPAASTKTTRASCSSCTRSASTAATRSKTSSTSRRRLPAGRCSRGRDRGSCLRPAGTIAARRSCSARPSRPGGVDEGERVLDIVAAHPATARHIATKLAIRFVSDNPPAALVDRAARDVHRDQGRSSRGAQGDPDLAGVRVSPTRIARR